MTDRQEDHPAAVAEAAPKGFSPLAMGFRRFRANRAAVASVGLLVVIVAACFSASVAEDHARSVSRQEELRVQRPHPWPPSLNHPFGTDTNGRDLLLRTLQGGAISLTVGLVSAAISVLIGTFYGAISGQAGGAVDRWMMRVVDILYGLPYILLVILILVYAERSLLVLFIAIGCVTWLTMARIIRGQVLRLREEEFIVAARALGARPSAVLVRHMVPNLMGPIIVCATLTVPVAILQESFLSLHLGAAGQLGHPGQRGGGRPEPDGQLLVAAGFSVRVPGGHAAVPELHRRRPPRRLRPETDLRQSLRAEADRYRLGLQGQQWYIPVIPLAFCGPCVV
ncbi:MAG: ABC transporter permease subunit [Anaerolineaceae bacterium]|nr:ABC transporter permease subunit [Anaerolineaceae bacterium]